MIASGNDKMVALDESCADCLQPHDQVVLNPREYRQWFDFSAVPPVDPSTVAGGLDDVPISRADSGPTGSQDIAATPASDVAADSAPPVDTSAAPVSTTRKGG